MVKLVADIPTVLEVRSSNPDTTLVCGDSTMHTSVSFGHHHKFWALIKR
jgi:hypothetical protein